MTIYEAAGLLMFSWITGYLFGFKLKNVLDAVRAI